LRFSTYSQKTQTGREQILKYKKGIFESMRNNKEENPKETIVGTFTKNKSFGFVVPDNKKISKDIFISKKYFSGAKSNDKVVAQITKPEIDGKKPEGKIIEILGNINIAGVDMLSIIKEYKLPYEFPKFVIDEARKIEKEISLDEIAGRKDFRNEEIFTIDGEDAKDLDDAVSVTKTKDDTYILSVHIADVSHYVMEGSFLDKEAITRGTSVYMLDRVIPMLPKELSNGICSLNEGKDRLTLSVIMEIDKKGNVISSDITKGVIKVTKRMSYNIVQKLLDLDNRAEIDEDLKQYIPYINHFKLMAELAHILENKRKENGYLDLDIPESKITLDKKGKAIDVGKYEIKFSNIIIEQFMLTANETVAEKFYWLEAPFIYRVHEAPDQEKITDLNRFLYNFGYKIKGNKENVHPKAFSSILEDIKGKDEEKVISNLILRTLKVARYEAENKGHFGIAGKYYCHFTSPIRRYPDLFIHRIISKYLDNNYMVSDDYKEKHEEFAVNYAEKSSEREKIAQKAERDSVDLKKAEYMENKIGEVYNGIVSGVTNFGLFVELENTVEGLIRFENLGNEYFNYDDMHKQLIGENTGIVYKIGDKVKIQVIEANKNLRKVAFAKYSDKEQSN
jgi:ribonuclease R